MTGMTENDFVQGIQYRLPSYEKYKSLVTKPLPHIQSRDEPSSIEEAAVRTDVSRHAITINEQVEEVLKRFERSKQPQRCHLKRPPKPKEKRKPLGYLTLTLNNRNYGGTTTITSPPQPEQDKIPTSYVVGNQHQPAKNLNQTFLTRIQSKHLHISGSGFNNNNNISIKNNNNSNINIKNNNDNDNDNTLSARNHTKNICKSHKTNCTENVNAKQRNIPKSPVTLRHNDENNHSIPSPPNDNSPRSCDSGGDRTHTPTIGCRVVFRYKELDVHNEDDKNMQQISCGQHEHFVQRHLKENDLNEGPREEMIEPIIVRFPFFLFFFVMYYVIYSCGNIDAQSKNSNLVVVTFPYFLSK